MIEKHDMAFWLAVFGATVVKLLTSEYGGPIRLFATVVAAIFSAYFFTVPAMHVLDLDPEYYTTVTAAVMALTGEGFMRWGMRLVDSLPSDPSKILELIREWRNGK